MKSTRGNTLLVELIVVILFFALSQAIVLQVFAKAQQTNHETTVLHRALMQARDVAETLAVSDNAEASLAALGFSPAQGDSLALTGDGYRLTAAIVRLTQPSGVLTTVTLTALHDGDELFSLPASHYKGSVSP